jgi:hypothetical protein
MAAVASVGLTRDRPCAVEPVDVQDHSSEAHFRPAGSNGAWSAFRSRHLGIPRGHLEEPGFLGGSRPVRGLTGRSVGGEVEICLFELLPYRLTLFG